MIEFQQLCKQYTLNNQIIHALSDVNLCIRKGEIFGIFGASGAGKTSLIRSVNLLDRPTSGQVIVNDANITTLSAQELRTHRRDVGMIFQHFNLLESRNAEQNIALPLEFLKQPKSAIDKTVNELLHWIHLEKHRHHYPRELSGGQKQRVAIARALATQPKILLCDEATSALDPQSTMSILKLLKKINQELGVTILLITHEMDVIKHICDRAAVIDHGKIIECGTVLELFAKPQSPITAQLVQKALHLELPEMIKAQLQTEPQSGKARLVRFTFVGDDSAQPFLSTLIQKFNLTINIIQANIEIIQQATVGFTVCSLQGDEAMIDRALATIRSETITAEVLGYV